MQRILGRTNIYHFRDSFCLVTDFENYSQNKMYFITCVLTRDQFKFSQSGSKNTFMEFNKEAEKKICKDQKIPKN